MTHPPSQAISDELERAKALAFAGDFSPDDLGGDIGTMTLRNPDGPALLEIIQRLLEDKEALDDDGLSGMWKVRAKRAETAIEKLESYCFGLETQVGGFRPPVIRELFSTTKADHADHG